MALTRRILLTLTGLAVLEIAIPACRKMLAQTLFSPKAPQVPPPPLLKPNVVGGGAPPITTDPRVVQALGAFVQREYVYEEHDGTNHVRFDLGAISHAFVSTAVIKGIFSLTDSRQRTSIPILSASYRKPPTVEERQRCSALSASTRIRRRRNFAWSVEVVSR